MMTTLALRKGTSSGYSDFLALITVVLVILHANLDQSPDSLPKIESMFQDHLSSPTLQFSRVSVSGIASSWYERDSKNSYFQDFL